MTEGYSFAVDQCSPGTVPMILFTDEEQFSRDGMDNTHDTHSWSPENPHDMAVSNFQN
jgi:hypothetical protein